MPLIEVNGIRLYVEEHGHGDPILCIHGTSSSAMAWRPAAIEQLSRLGHVIVYDRRGCTRSERPEPYTTSVAQQAQDAAALLDSLVASPAIVIGRSYGGAVALQLTVDRPELVTGLVLLEPAAPAYIQEGKAWDEELRARIEDAAAGDPSSASEALLRDVLGDDHWEALPEPMRDMFRENAPAVLAEMRGPGLEATIEDLRAIKVHALLVGAEDSEPIFRRMNGRLEELIPLARTALVPGSHFLDPGEPAVLAFLEEVMAGGG